MSVSEHRDMLRAIADDDSWPTPLLLALFFVTFTGLQTLHLLVQLLEGKSLDAVYLIYLWYAVGVVLTLHVLLFLSVEICKLNNAKLSRSIPKYLDYAYILVISIGLAQVLFLRPEMAEFYESLVIPEDMLLQQTKQVAETVVKRDCVKPYDQYFTVAFCDKMRQITDARDVEFKQVLLTTIISDSEFMKHAVGWRYVGCGRFSRCSGIEIRNPVAMYVNRLKERGEYLKQLDEYQTQQDMHNDKRTRFAYTWLTMLLLPLGIGLRVVKTSMELFVDLA